MRNLDVYEKSVKTVQLTVTHHGVPPPRIWKFVIGLHLNVDYVMQSVEQPHKPYMSL